MGTIWDTNTTQRLKICFLFKVFALNSFWTMHQFSSSVPGATAKEGDGGAAREAGRDIQEHPIALSTQNQLRSFNSEWTPLLTRSFLHECLLLTGERAIIKWYTRGLQLGIVHLFRHVYSIKDLHLSSRCGSSWNSHLGLI